MSDNATPAQPTGPGNDSIRASTRDRDETAAILNEALQEGRLTADEHDQRMSQCYAATTMGQLNALTADLPHTAGAVPAPPPPAPPVAMDPWTAREQEREQERAARYGWYGGGTIAGIWLGWGCLAVLMIIIWAFSGMGDFWPVWVIAPTLVGAIMATYYRRSGGSS